MEKPVVQKLIHKVRKNTPLPLRHKIGPVMGVLWYGFDKYVWKSKKIPNVLPILDTIDLIQKDKLSVIRFGDGEIFMLDGGDTAFQQQEGDLVERLESVIRTNREGLLICLPGIWDGLEKFDTVAYWFFMHHLYRNGHVWKALFNPLQTYGDTNITRPYLAYKDKKNCGLIFEKLFELWEDKDVVLIEGEKSRLGVGNNMFDKVKSMQRILCPPENAYGKFNQIKSEIMKQDKNKLILLSLGPTAKVLAYDLFLIGYRVIDIGHIDMEYEMFLRQEKKLTRVPYKYFNEINERNPEECTDEKYLSQIIARINH